MTVLVVEDAEEVIESITVCLTTQWPDCDVRSTAKGHAALRLLKDKVPDLVLLDLVMS